jgi:phage terminase small subunit
MRAGCEPGTARVRASLWLSKQNVAEAVAKAFARQELTADSVRREIAAVANSQLRRVASWSKDGGLVLVDSDQLDEADASAIDAVTEERRERIELGQDGVPDVKVVDRRFKIKLHDKVAALALAAKVLGLVRERHELSGPDGGPIPVDARVVVYELPANGREVVVAEGKSVTAPALLSKNGQPRNGKRNGKGA